MNRSRLHILVFSALVALLAACGGGPDPDVPTVTVNVTGAENGTVTVNGEAYTSPVDIVAGGEAVIVATPDEGYAVEWGGACAAAEGTTCTLSAVEEDQTVEVAFVEEDVEPTVTVNVVGGENGTVTVNDAEYAGPVDVEAGSDVVIVATPNEGYRVVWTGACTGTAGTTCTLASVTADTTVGVRFVEEGAEPATYDVTVNVTEGAENGTVTVNGTEYTAPVTVEEGSSVTIAAEPAEGYTTRWGDAGPCADAAGNECVIEGIAADTVVDLAFVEDTTPDQHDVTYTVTGETNGNVDIAVNGTPYTGGSPITIDGDDTVTFTATPNAGYDVAWTGACAVEGAVTDATCTLSGLTADATVGIEFVEETTAPGLHGISSRVDASSPNVEIEGVGTWDSGTFATLTGLAELIQPVVDLPDWNPAENAIVLVIEGAQDEGDNLNASRRARDYRLAMDIDDEVSPTPEPGTTARLFVTYTPAGGGAAVTVEQGIDSNDDDAEEFVTGANTDNVYNQPGAVFTNSQDLDLGYDSQFASQIVVGLRFDDIEIPAGATITEAHLRFYPTEGGATALDLRVSSQLSANPEPFADADGGSGTTYRMPEAY